MKTTQQTTPTSHEQTEAKAEVIKLGLDIHKNQYVVVQQTDGQAPRSPQRFKPDAFLQWVGKLCKQAKSIVTCYEAGCFGYVLHRQLEAMGIRNLVVRPRNWDEYGSKVKTDGRDARELCSCLDRYLAGNIKALSVVRVPTEEQERSRSLSRQREVLTKERKRLQSVGVSNARYYGIELKMSWWKNCNFKKLLIELPDYLLVILKPFQSVLVAIDEQLREVTAREERKANRRVMSLSLELRIRCVSREAAKIAKFLRCISIGTLSGLLRALRLEQSGRELKIHFLSIVSYVNASTFLKHPPS